MWSEGPSLDFSKIVQIEKFTQKWAQKQGGGNLAKNCRMLYTKKEKSTYTNPSTQADNSRLRLLLF